MWQCNIKCGLCISNYLIILLIGIQLYIQYFQISISLSTIKYFFFRLSSCAVWVPLTVILKTLVWGGICLSVFSSPSFNFFHTSQIWIVFLCFLSHFSSPLVESLILFHLCINVFYVETPLVCMHMLTNSIKKRLWLLRLLVGDIWSPLPYWWWVGCLGAPCKAKTDSPPSPTWEMLLPCLLCQGIAHGLFGVGSPDNKSILIFHAFSLGASPAVYHTEGMEGFGKRGYYPWTPCTWTVFSCGTASSVKKQIIWKSFSSSKVSAGFLLADHCSLFCHIVFLYVPAPQSTEVLRLRKLLHLPPSSSS